MNTGHSPHHNGSQLGSLSSGVLAEWSACSQKQASTKVIPLCASRKRFSCQQNLRPPVPAVKPWSGWRASLHGRQGITYIHQPALYAVCAAHQPPRSLLLTQALCLHLLCERALGTASFWHPYIATLPDQVRHRVRVQYIVEQCLSSGCASWLMPEPITNLKPQAK